MLDAVGALNGVTEGLAVVIDNDARVVGVLTDGDIRRALLKDRNLYAPISPYVNRHFLSAAEDESRDSVLDLMQARRVKHIPILDTERRLVGIHALHDLIGPAVLPNHAVIMAGGKGTRLWPLTKNVPKPMIPVAGKPILERLMLHLMGCGVRRIHIAVNYLADLIINHFGDGRRFGCEITYLHETEELGTGGALSLLPTGMEHPFLVLNGDLVTHVDFHDMIRRHSDSGAKVTIGYSTYAHQVPFGCLSVDGNRVVTLQEKPLLEQSVNAGIYVLDPCVISHIPRRLFPITELFQLLLSHGDHVGVYEITSHWMDIGTHGELNRALGRGAESHAR